MSKMNYNRIKSVLADAGKSNLDLATHLGKHENSVSAWCTNKNQPNWDTLFLIAEYFEVEAGELLTLRKNLKPIKKTTKRVSKKDTPKKK